MSDLLSLVADLASAFETRALAPKAKQLNSVVFFIIDMLVVGRIFYLNKRVYEEILQRCRKFSSKRQETSI